MHTDPTEQTHPAAPTWHQVDIRFTDHATAEDITARWLRPALDQTTSWWFTRKSPTWRVRHLTRDAGSTAHGRAALTRTLDDLRSEGEVTDWTEVIYEPEIHAFGGTQAMSAAHTLFHHDSAHILTRPRGPGHRREHTILLCSALLRAAGQDWYEQGDIWARVAQNRRPDPGHPDTPQQGLHRLMTVDTDPGSPLIASEGQLAELATWFTAFHTAGRTLGDLARRGELTRGLRAVLAHHVIFHWNRLGLSHQTQSHLAAAAHQVVLL